VELVSKVVKNLHIFGIIHTLGALCQSMAFVRVFVMVQSEVFAISSDALCYIS
jgi:hypothetical protein